MPRLRFRLRTLMILVAACSGPLTFLRPVDLQETLERHPRLSY